jgi:uroporphyrinogen-III decarboxylase
MEGVKNWENMTWQEKRDARFKRWLNTDNIRFKNPGAKELYLERINRFIKAIKMEEPDRVPVILPTGFFPAYYAGISFHDMMYDIEAMRAAWLKFMYDFGDMDSFMGPMLVMQGKVMEALEVKNQKWPGYGISEDAFYYQFVEGEYMKADEYDHYLNDPVDYSIRVQLPRTAGLFKPFERMMPLRALGFRMSWVAMFTDPEMRKLFQTLMDLAPEYEKWQKAVFEIMQLIKAEGYPDFGGGGFSGAPYDMIADGLRGTRGISVDMYRQPEKILEAMELNLPRMIEQTIRMADMADCPIIMMPLHKGDDRFMSDAQFEKFYWPTFKKLLLAMIEEGIVPFPFAEGAYNRRLEPISDMPKAGVVWYFDQTDMKEAKKTVGKVSCIAGNTPTSLLITGTPEQVTANCRQLIEDCAPGGGYILTGGAHIDIGKIENLHAMMDAAKKYGVY